MNFLSFFRSARETSLNRICEGRYKMIIILYTKKHPWRWRSCQDFNFSQKLNQMTASPHPRIIIVIVKSVAQSPLLEKKIFKPSSPGRGMTDHAAK